MIATADTASTEFATMTNSLRMTLLRELASFHSSLSNIAFRLTLKRRDIELCIRLDSTLIRSQLLNGIDLPTDSANFQVAAWAVPDEVWGDTAALKLEVGGGTLVIPLEVLITDNKLSMKVAAPPLFTGGSLSRTVFANVLPASFIFERNQSAPLPSFRLSSTGSKVTRAHVRQGAVRLFNVANPPFPNNELSPLALDAQDLTLFLTAAFLQRLLTPLTGLPVGVVTVRPSLRALQFVIARSQKKGIKLFCEIEVTVRATVLVQLELQSLNAILASGEASSTELSWDLDGICNLAFDLVKATARAIGKDIRQSMNIPTNQNPISRTLRCQGVRLLQLDWRSGGVGIHFRRATPNRDLLCS